MEERLYYVAGDPSGLRGESSLLLVGTFIAMDGRGKEIGRIYPPSDLRTFEAELKKLRPTIIDGFPEFALDYVRLRGRAPRAGVAAMSRVTIRLTETERQRWEKAAGGMPLADWIRMVCDTVV